GRSPAVPEELYGLHRVKPGSLQVDAPRLRCESELLGAHTVTARQRQNLPELTLLFGHLVRPAPEHSSRNSSIWVASGKRRQSFVVPREPCQHAGFDLRKVRYSQDHPERGAQSTSDCVPALQVVKLRAATRPPAGVRPVIRQVVPKPVVGTLPLQRSPDFRGRDCGVGQAGLYELGRLVIGVQILEQIDQRFPLRVGGKHTPTPQLEEELLVAA